LAGFSGDFFVGLAGEMLARSSSEEEYAGEGS